MKKTKLIIIFVLTALLSLQSAPAFAANLSLELKAGGENSVEASWNSVSKAKYYSIYVLDDRNKCHANTWGLTDTEFTIKNLPSDRVYSVTISAYIDDPAAAIAESGGKIFLPSEGDELEPPYAISATKISGDSATLKWKKVPGAVSYEVLFDDKSYETAEPKLEVSELTPGESYSYKVKSKSMTGESRYSSTRFLMTVSDTMPAPNKVSAKASLDKVTIEWNAVKEAESYEVLFEDDVYPVTEGTSLEVAELAANTRYSYSVRALNASESSPFGRSRTIKTKAATAAPATPENDSVYAKANSVTVSWSAVFGAESYNVVFNGVSYKTTDTSKTFEGLAPGVSYTYSLNAVNSKGASPYTAAKTIRTSARATD